MKRFARISRYTSLASLCIALTGVVGGALGQSLGVDWWSTDGGGATERLSVNFQLSGTIAQPDAGVFVMSGSTLELTGGFWAGTPAAPAICRGDTNCDGKISFADINPFVEALINGVYCDDTGDNTDMDGNGSVGFEDINPFVDLLTTSALPIVCP